MPLFSLFWSSSISLVGISIILYTSLLAPATIVLVHRWEFQMDWLSHRKKSTFWFYFLFLQRTRTLLPSIHKHVYHDPKKVAEVTDHIVKFFPFSETRKVATIGLAHRRRALVLTGKREHGVVLLTYCIESIYHWLNPVHWQIFEFESLSC